RSRGQACQSGGHEGTRMPGRHGRPPEADEGDREMSFTPVHGVDVRDFGARGDGVADDGPAIQRALDEAPAGATVLLPLGRYAIDAPLTVRGSRRVLGAGAFTRWGRISQDWNSINAPVAEPWVDGTVIVQRTPGCDAI